MLFCNDVTGWNDVIYDGNSMASRLKVLEHLLLSRLCDMSMTGGRLSDGTLGGHDASEMPFFLDGSLSNLINEYEGQLSKYEAILDEPKLIQHNNSVTIFSFIAQKYATLDERNNQI